MSNICITIQSIMSIYSSINYLYHLEGYHYLLTAHDSGTRKVESLVIRLIQEHQAYFLFMRMT